ncbi:MULTISPECIES: hypothetical protein [unclassified Streptomyces]|uniref:hypothetical protein n=1 Tax=unclassified Streptomyces TaxID=2593676 RepID=UPI003325174D
MVGQPRRLLRRGRELRSYTVPKSAGYAVLTDPSSGDERVYASYAGGDAVNVRKRRRGQPGQARGDRVTFKLS